MLQNNKKKNLVLSKHYKTNTINTMFFYRVANYKCNRSTSGFFNTLQPKGGLLDPYTISLEQ